MTLRSQMHLVMVETIWKRIANGTNASCHAWMGHPDNTLGGAHGAHERQSTVMVGANEHHD